MPGIFREVAVLRNEGKLHKKLLFRNRILILISLVLIGIVIFNIVSRGAGVIVPVALLVAGFVVGMFVFSRMNVIQWDEEKEIVAAGRMDAVGYAVLALYIGSEIALRTFLKDAFPLSATVYILSTVAGTLLGRAVGTVVEIHRVYTAEHSS